MSVTKKNVRVRVSLILTGPNGEYLIARLITHQLL